MCRLIYLRSILFLMYHKDNFTFFSKGKKYYFTDSEISLVSGITAFVFFKSVLTCHATASCYLGVDRLVFFGQICTRFELASVCSSTPTNIYSEGLFSLSEVFYCLFFLFFKKLFLILIY